MTDKELVLMQAIEAGLAVLRKNYGDDYIGDAKLMASSSILLEAMWPIIENYHNQYSKKEFSELFAARFPDYELQELPGTVFEYIVGNVQQAVACEIILLLETWEQTLEEASQIKRFRAETPARDWEVGKSHVREIISEVKQYRIRGQHGHHSTHTGSNPTIPPAEALVEGVPGTSGCVCGAEGSGTCT